MASTRNPFDNVEEMFERMARQFEEASRAWTDEGGYGAGHRNGMDVADEGDAFVVAIDVPGFERSDLRVRLAGDTLHVGGDTTEAEETTDEARDYIRRERHERSFDRRVTLPDPVAGEDITARLNNGVLTVTLPKAEPTEAGTDIEIE